MPQPSSQRDINRPMTLDDVLALPPCEVAYADFPREGLVLYGGGRLGKMASALLEKAGYTLRAVVDRNAVSVQKDFSVPVLMPEQAIAQLSKDVYIFDCVFKEQPNMAQQVFAPHGFKNIYTVYDLMYAIPSLHFMNGWQSGPLNAEDIAGISKVYHRLADEASRAVYLTQLAWRIARVPLSYPEFTLVGEEEKYFGAITRWPGMQDKCAIDAGAFDLFFTLQALDVKRNSYPPSRVIALEPDPESFARCQHILEDVPHAVLERITLLPTALSNKLGAVRLIGGYDLSSKLVYADNLTGSEQLVHCEATTLDQLGEELPDIGYIKLHVEGEELPCIQGGLKCIEKHRPMLVMNCSHNRDGLWKLQLLTMQHTPEYCYYFRAHAHYGEGLSFYAVPRS